MNTNTIQKKLQKSYNSGGIENTLNCLKDICKSDEINISKISDKIGINRMTIYDMFKSKNPKIETLNAFLQCIGIKLSFELKE
jgi:DNA-binding phage protein